MNSPAQARTIERSRDEQLRVNVGGGQGDAVISRT